MRAKQIHTHSPLRVPGRRRRRRRRRPARPARPAGPARPRPARLQSWQQRVAALHARAVAGRARSFRPERATRPARGGQCSARRWRRDR